MDSHTYLGVTISSDLRWQNHTSMFLQKHQGSLILLDAMSMDALRRRRQRLPPHHLSFISLLNQLEWLPLSVRRKNSRLVAFYKAVNNLSPVPVGQPRPCSHQTRLYDPLTFIPRTDYKYSFLPRTIVVVDWNSLAVSAILTTSQAVG